MIRVCLILGDAGVPLAAPALAQHHSPIAGRWVAQDAFGVRYFHAYHGHRLHADGTIEGRFFYAVESDGIPNVVRHSTYHLRMIGPGRAHVHFYYDDGSLERTYDH